MYFVFIFCIGPEIVMGRAGPGLSMSGSGRARAWALPWRPGSGPGRAWALYKLIHKIWILPSVEFYRKFIHLSWLGQNIWRRYKTTQNVDIEQNKWFAFMISTFLIKKSKNYTSFFSKNSYFKSPSKPPGFWPRARAGLEPFSKSRASGPTKNPGSGPGPGRAWALTHHY